MSQTITVREFETIICNESFKGEHGYVFIDQKHFEDLTAFIHEFTSTCEADVLDFLRIGFKRHIGPTITFKNYIGVIQLKDGFQLEILPKIDLSEDKDNKKTKQILVKMLRSMKDFPSKVFTSANLNISKMNLYEIFIAMYIQEVRQLIKKGMKSSYVEKEDNLSVFKGKLIVKEQLNRNLVHKEKFYVRYDEFLLDIPENKLIKATLEKLKRITKNFSNSKEISQLLVHFETVNSSVNYLNDFHKVIISRNNQDYELILKWSQVFLLNKSFTSFSGSTSSRAWLFPMESIYENYIAQQIKNTFVPQGWNVSLQDKHFWLFDEPRKFALRPDIVLEKDGRKFVLDTKWKALTDNPSINYGISQADMYQMYAYSKKYKTSEIYLLYPVTNEMRKHIPISFSSVDETTMHVCFMDLENIDISLKQLFDVLTDEA